MSLKELVHEKIWDKGKGEVEDIVLYALSQSSVPLGPSFFIKEFGEPEGFRKTTFYKYFGKLTENGFVDTEIDKSNRRKVKYRITPAGEIYLTKRLEEYDIDSETIFDREIKMGRNVINQLKPFFKDRNITSDKLMLEYVNITSSIPFNLVSGLIPDIKKFETVLLFLAYNHPNLYPKYSISIEDFLISEKIISRTELQLFLERLEKGEYGIRFHKLVLKSEDLNLYFSEGSDLGRHFQLHVDSKLIKLAQKASLGKIDLNREELDNAYKEIILTLTEKNRLFDKKLGDALYPLIENFRKVMTQNINQGKPEYQEIAKTIELTQPKKMMYREEITQESSLFEKYLNLFKFQSLSEKNTFFLENTIDKESLDTFREYFNIYSNYMSYNKGEKLAIDFNNDLKDDKTELIWNLIEKQDYKNAILEIDKLMTTENNAKFYYWKAKILGLYLLDKDNALNVIEKGIEIDPIPNGYNFYRLKAEILLRELDDFIRGGNPKEVEIAEKGLNAVEMALKFDDGKDLYQKKLRFLIILGRLDEAEKLSKNLISRSKYGEELYDRAEQLLKQNSRPEDALMVINKAIEIEGKAKYYLLKGNILRTFFNRINDARINFELAMKIGFDKEINSYDISDLVQIIWFIKGNGYDDFIIDFVDKIIKRRDLNESNITTFLFEKADALKNKRQYDAALEILDKISMEMERYLNPLYFGLKAEVFLGLKRYKEALEAIDEANSIMSFDEFIIIKINILNDMQEFVAIFDLIKEYESDLEYEDHGFSEIFPHASEVLILSEEYDLAFEVFTLAYSGPYPIEMTEMMDDYFENYIYYSLKDREYERALSTVKKYQFFNSQYLELKNPKLVEYQIFALIGLNSLQEALIIVDQAIEEFPKYPAEAMHSSINHDPEIIPHYNFRVHKARILLLLDKNQEALDLLENLIKSTPSPAAIAYQYKAIAYFKEKKYKDALRQINAAIKLDYKESKYYRIKSSILFESDRLADALDALNTAMTYGSNVPENYYTKARILYFLGRSEEALDVVNQGFDLFPNYLDFYELRNLILSTLGRYPDALEGIKEALEKGANYTGIYHEKADMLHYLKRYDVALETVNKAIETNPEDFESYYLKILILIQLKEFDEAFKVLENNKHRFTESDHSSSSYNNTKADIFDAKARYFAENDMEHEAIKAIENAIELTELFKGEHYHSYGKILIKFEHYEKALEILRLSMKKAAMKDDVDMYLGTCYEHLDEFDKALECYERAKSYFSSEIKKFGTTTNYKRAQERKRFVDLLREANIRIDSIKKEGLFHIYVLETTDQSGEIDHIISITKNLRRGSLVGFESEDEDSLFDKKDVKLGYLETATNLYQAKKRMEELKKLSKDELKKLTKKFEAKK